MRLLENKKFTNSETFFKEKFSIEKDFKFEMKHQIFQTYTTIALYSMS